MLTSDVRNLKKIELHRHFEGCISPEIFHKLVLKHHPRSRYTDIDEIKKLYKFTDFQGFLDAFKEVIHHIKFYDSFAFLAETIASDLKEENIVYTEFLFSPQWFLKLGLDVKKILKIILNKFDESKVKTGLIIDIVRSEDLDKSLEFLKMIISIRDRSEHLREWIKGISIGGNEVKNPAKWFEKHFQFASENDLRLTAHAGEWDNYKSVKDAIEVLKVERIGHGITSVQNEDLVQDLITSKICLDVSISSNYCTGIATKGEHPVRELFRKGVNITLNTDDPGFFNTDLNQEYVKFLELGFEIDDLYKIQRDAISASFLSEGEKDELLDLVFNDQ